MEEARCPCRKITAVVEEISDSVGQHRPPLLSRVTPFVVSPDMTPSLRPPPSHLLPPSRKAAFEPFGMKTSKPNLIDPWRCQRWTK